MDSNTANEKSVNNNSIASTKDDAWFVCDSKSRPGLRYYVNKVTGIKVWNITDAEIAFAENFGKDCAEPPRYQPMHHQTDTKYYNKQITNLQFTNQLPNVVAHPNMGDMTSERGSLQYQGQQCFTLVPTAIAPQIHQFAASESLHKAYQQLLHIPNILSTATTNNLQNLTVPISQYAQNQKQNYFPCNKNKRYRQNKWNRNINMNRNNQNSCDFQNRDLRIKLVRKRRCKSSGEEGDEDFGQSNSIRFNNKLQNEQGLQETSTRLDLTPLKHLTASGTNFKWYIVVDKNTIINNYNYLNNMIASDANCKLFIPFHVITELKEHAMGSTNVQPRRILRFLSQQIESGLIKMGHEETEEQGAHATIMTCVKLVMQNINVVLISNNDDILKCKHNQHGVHIFTMESIKDILENKTVTSRAWSPTLAIKITVPNDAQRTENERTPSQLSAHIDPVGTQIVDTDFQNKDPIRELTVESSITQTYLNPTKSSDCASPASTPIDTNTKQATLTRNVSEHKEETQTRWRWRMKKANANLPKELKASQMCLETDRTKNTAAVDRQTSAHSSPSNLQTTTSNMSVVTDDGSEASVFNIPRDNITVAETSTSAISNTESSFSDKTTIPNKQKSKQVTLREVFMFKVAYESMEDVLRTRCDEWVSRFVQIMEEILREKLQEVPPFENKEYPPPWNLQEAARCIIKKFSENFNVVDAANKLSFILYKISDEHGKITENISPADYMEMFSYGVYLVETLQDISSNCEDLQTASDSLKKLLHDIQNGSLDINQQDHFTDNLHELALHGTNCDFDVGGEVDKNKPNHSPAEPMETDSCEPKVVQPAEEDTDKSYELCSRNRKSEIDRTEEPASVVELKTKESELSFFVSLKLMKNQMKKADVHTQDNDLHEHVNGPSINVKCPVSVMSEPKSPEEKQPPDIVDINVHVNDNDTVAPPLAPQTKVIRKFTKFEEFERRLMEKQLESNYEDDDDEYEYADDENEYADDFDVAYKKSEVNQEPQVDEDIVGDTPIEKDPERRKNFLRAMGRVLRRLGDVFTQVKLQCEEYVEEVNGPQRSGSSRRVQLRDKVDKACSCIGTIRDSLDCIIKRELYDKDINIQRLLEIANVEDFIPDDMLCSEYRDVIVKCKDQAELLLSGVRTILKTVQTLY